MDERVAALEKWRAEMTAQHEAMREALAHNTDVCTETNKMTKQILVVWTVAQMGGNAFTWLVKAGCAVIVAWASWRALKP